MWDGPGMNGWMVGRLDGWTFWRHGLLDGFVEVCRVYITFT